MIAIAFLVSAVFWASPGRQVFDGVGDDALTSARHTLFDSRFEAPNVVVIGVDARSLAAPELATLPRAMFAPFWAEIADATVRRGGAAAIGFDFILSFDAGLIQFPGGEALKGFDRELLKIVSKRSDLRGRIALVRTADIAPARRLMAIAGADAMAGAELPLDPDGGVRRVDAIIGEYDAGGALPGLARRLTDMAGRPPWDHIDLLPPARLTTLPSVSMIDVLRCAQTDNASPALKALFANKVVLVGSVLPIEDRRRAADAWLANPPRPPATDPSPCTFPRSDTLGANPVTSPGVFIHAAAADAVMSGWAPVRFGASASAFSIAIVSLFGGVIGLWWRGGRAVAACVVTLALTAGLAVLALEAGVVAPVARLALALLAAFGLAQLAQAVLLERRQRKIQRDFGQYISPAIVERLAEDDQRPQLGGETRDATIMFADLSGFTALSERLKDSEKLMAVTNAYLSLIVEEVERTGGYVDKFIGDAVMAIWNAPAPLDRHGHAGAEAAWAAKDRIANAARKDEARGMPSFSVKIGVNSGEVTVGNVGSANRFNYTAVGEAVNIAARLESLPGDFGVQVIFGPDTAADAASGFLMMELVSIRVKGKQELVAIYAPLCRHGAADEQAQMTHAARYTKALAAFRAGKLQEAHAEWQALAAETWVGAGPSATMAGWASTYLAETPDMAAWDGGLTRTSK